MPVASRSDIEIAQRACVMAGISKISSFSDTDNEVAITLNDIYEDVVADCLTIHPWRFATYTLSLGPPLAAPPPVDFNSAFALPTDIPPLQIRTLWLSGTIAYRYKLMGSELWVDASPNDTAELEALFRLNEAQWPPWFTLYAILRVASFLGGAITRNGGLAKFHADEAEKQLARARNRDSVQQTTQKIRLTKIRSTRLGGRPMA